MHVDRSGQVDGAVDHRPAQQLLPARSVAGAEHQLCGVLRGGELDEGGGDVGTGDLVELPPDVLEQLAVLVEQFRIRPGEPVLAADVQAEELSMGALGDARRTADQPFGAWSTGDGDDDALTRLPRLGDPVALAILLEADVDLVGNPQQGQLAQRGEVARPEVVGRARQSILSGA